ncbi:protein XpsM [Luteimonas padinae]|uniref:Type II secretion system protein GspM n=1 Tax=Luteimonas padinae TaxID=1714359 RepID=A0ABV6SWM2_9GAMM|nr:type II secretion system protein GspM [Luteimonas padinae]GHD74077.1 protein XpsM [Luteimonas padinae]
MREAIPDRDRWLALAILAGVLALAYLVLVHPWWTAPMLEAGERIESLQERDLRVRMELAQAPQVQTRLEEVRAVAARVPGFMDERSAELATAALSARLETAVLEASPGNRSCAIRNRSPMTDTRQQDRFRRALVQVRLHCGNPELAAVLHSLEDGSPRLFVDNLNVLAPRQPFGRGAGAGTQGAGLDVTFDLYGYLQPQPAAAGASDAR